MHSAAPARISLPLEPPHRKTRLKTCGLDVSHHRIWYAYQRTTTMNSHLHKTTRRIVHSRSPSPPRAAVFLCKLQSKPETYPLQPWQ